MFQCLHRTHNSTSEVGRHPAAALLRKRLVSVGELRSAVRVLFLASALLTAFTPQLSAQVTYTYSGNPFTIFVVHFSEKHVLSDQSAVNANTTTSITTVNTSKFDDVSESSLREAVGAVAKATDLLDHYVGKWDQAVNDRQSAV